MGGQAGGDTALLLRDIDESALDKSVGHLKRRHIDRCSSHPAERPKRRLAVLHSAFCSLCRALFARSLSALSPSSSSLQSPFCPSSSHASPSPPLPAKLAAVRICAPAALSTRGRRDPTEQGGALSSTGKRLPSAGQTCKLDEAPSCCCCPLTCSLCALFACCRASSHTPSPCSRWIPRVHPTTAPLPSFGSQATSISVLPSALPMQLRSPGRSSSLTVLHPIPTAYVTSDRAAKQRRLQAQSD